MRNAHIDNVDHIQRPLIAIGTDYPPGFQLPLHSHRRAQLLYGATGVMQVFTRQATGWCRHSMRCGCRRRCRMR